MDTWYNVSKYPNFFKKREENDKKKESQKKKKRNRWKVRAGKREREKGKMGFSLISKIYGNWAVGFCRSEKKS